MIVWITIKLFELMFGVTIEPIAMSLLLVVGFIEVLSEVVLLIGSVVVLIVNSRDKE